MIAYVPYTFHLRTSSSVVGALPLAPSLSYAADHDTPYRNTPQSARVYKFFFFFFSQGALDTLFSSSITSSIIVVSKGLLRFSTDH